MRRSRELAPWRMRCAGRTALPGRRDGLERPSSVSLFRKQALAVGLKMTLLAALAGCGSSDRVSIQGQVTFDGQPVGPGSIVFLPETSREAIKVAAPIEAGQYQIGPERGAAPGPVRVEISWSKKTGRQIPSADPGMMMDETQEAIPPRYNTDSTLRRELQPGENVLDFVLTAQ